MPLIVISGYPSSGKTKRALELRKFLEEKGKHVHHISENKAIAKAGFSKNVCFADSQNEKIVRSDLKSEALRLLDKESVVILDAGNYIKGYRYELFCATKAARSTQCTLFCAIQKERAWEFNQNRRDKEELELSKVDDVSKLDNSNIPYSREIFEGLCMRFEEPHGNCRWDSTLFVTFPDHELEFEAIYSALFESNPLRPNKSTQNPPLSSTSYLFDLDRITREIVEDILGIRKLGVMGPLPIKNSDIAVNIPQNLNAIQMNRLRRQFLNYSKLHHATTSSLDKIPQLFVQFLNSNCVEAP